MAKAKKTKASETSKEPAAPAKTGAKKAAATPAETPAPSPAAPAKAPVTAKAESPEAPKKGGRKPAAKKGAKEQAPAKAEAAKTAQPAAPLIDTNLVAQAAAAMLVGKANLGEQQQAQPTQESSTFKNLKEQIAHPRPAALSHLLGGVGGAKKSGAHSILGQQKGHNQTIGHFNKTGVPRRTNG